MNSSSLTLLDDVLENKKQEVLLIHERIMQCKRILEEMRNKAVNPYIRQTSDQIGKSHPGLASAIRSDSKPYDVVDYTAKIIQDSAGTKGEPQSIVIGNTSKFIRKDPETRRNIFKWLVYVSLDSLQTMVEKVRFCLHPSYKPDDVVDVAEPPFQLMRSGYGEFVIRILIFFRGHGASCGSRTVQIFHRLELDSTFTGQETAGKKETIITVVIKGDEIIVQNKNSDAADRPQYEAELAYLEHNSNRDKDLESDTDEGPIEIT